MEDFTLSYRGSPWYLVQYGLATAVFGFVLFVYCGPFAEGPRWYVVAAIALQVALNLWGLCLELLRRRHAGVTLTGEGIVASDWRGRVATISWEGCDRVIVDAATLSAHRLAVRCGKQERTVGWFPPKDAILLRDEIRQRLERTA